MSIILQYVDGTSTTQSITLTELYDKGIDEPDDVLYYPEAKIQRAAGGNFWTLPLQCFNRVMTVNVGIVSDFATRIFFHNFYFTKNASGVHENYIVYGGETIRVEFDRSALKNIWKEDCQYEKAYQFTFYEKMSRTTMPASW